MPTPDAPTMTRLILILAVILAILAGCAPEPPRAIDGWQSVIDQGWVQP